MKDKQRQAKNMRRGHYRRKYCYTVKSYIDQLNLQNGECLVCGRTDNFGRRFFCIDHSHTTGKLRGLLCDGCNLLVGRVEHNIKCPTEIFEKIQDYLCFSIDISDLECIM